MKLWMAPKGLHVEPARADDAPALARLHAEGFVHGWPTTDFATYLADPQKTPAYLACDRRRQAAGFALVRLAGDEAELLTLTVRRKWRGKGVGTALLRAAFGDLLMSPARHMFLEVEEDNASALALYHRLGFVQIGERKAYYPKADGTAATARLLRRELD